MDLNKVQVIGNCTTDIELKETPNGQKVANFSVATNRSWNDANGQKQEQAEFHNIVMWGNLAEIAANFLKKGKKVYIEGRLQTRTWEVQDGSKRYKTEIVGESIILLGGKDGDTNTTGSNKTSNQSTQKENTQNTNKEDEVSIEDLPF